MSRRLAQFLGIAIIAGGLAGATAARAEEPRRGGTFHVQPSWGHLQLVHHQRHPQRRRAGHARPGRPGREERAQARDRGRSEDGTVYTFKIRENVKLHQRGREVVTTTASSTRTRRVLRHCRRLHGLLSWMKSVTARVTITLTELRVAPVRRAGLRHADDHQRSRRWGWLPPRPGRHRAQVQRAEHPGDGALDDYWGAYIDTASARSGDATLRHARRRGHMINRTVGRARGPRGRGLVISREHPLDQPPRPDHADAGPQGDQHGDQPPPTKSSGTGRAEYGMLSPGTFAYKPGYVSAPYDPEGAKALLADDALTAKEARVRHSSTRCRQRDLKKISRQAQDRVDHLPRLQGMPEGP